MVVGSPVPIVPRRGAGVPETASDRYNWPPFACTLRVFEGLASTWVLLPAVPKVVCRTPPLEVASHRSLPPLPAPAPRALPVASLSEVLVSTTPAADTRKITRLIVAGALLPRAVEFGSACA